MVFSSLVFIFRFLPVFLIAYYLTPKAYRNVTLLIGSLVFYAFGEPVYLLLILLSLLVNYRLGLAISRQPKNPRRRWLLFVFAMLYNFGSLTA